MKSNKPIVKMKMDSLKNSMNPKKGKKRVKRQQRADATNKKQLRWYI